MTTTFSDGSVFSNEPVPAFQVIDRCTSCIGSGEPAWTFQARNSPFIPGYAGGSYSGSTDSINLINVIQLVGANNEGSINPLPFSSYSAGYFAVLAARIGEPTPGGEYPMDARGLLTSFQPYTPAVPIPQHCRSSLPASVPWA
jgi:hypothetical protein